jgi:hypothetical protein
VRDFAGERLLVLASFRGDEQWVPRAILDEHGLGLTPEAAVPDGRPVREDGEHLVLAPYQFCWIAR